MGFKNFVFSVGGLLIIALSVAMTIPLFANSQAQAQSIVAPPESVNLQITNATVEYHQDWDVLIFEQRVAGKAGETIPTAKGKLDGAPVLGYVFPTTLAASDVGFGDQEGIVALAVTSHPDFDDTPLWDENNDGNYENDGRVYHAHWVLLEENNRIEGGLAVKEYSPDDESVVLPPTHPDMPMYIDSPGFTVQTKGAQLRVMVPARQVNHQTSFNYDAVTAYMQANTSKRDRPMLGVYKVYSIRSGDLSLPYSVQ